MSDRIELAGAVEGLAREEPGQPPASSSTRRTAATGPCGTRGQIGRSGAGAVLPS